MESVQDPLLRAIALRGRIVRFPAGQIIIQEGATDQCLYVILAGTVKVYSSNEGGREVVLDLHGPGGYVGEMALDAGERSASVVTQTACTCAVVSGADLHAAVQECPALALQIINELIRRLRTATDKVKSLALRDVFGRVTAQLRQLAVERTAAGLVSPRLTHQDLANYCGCAREMVTRVLKELTDGGFISVSAHRITLPRELPRDC